MLPKISIITPSYNQGHYIEETILSIINQGYPNYELIIIDGGSTDNTVDVIKKYESNIAYWVSEKDKGQSDAINKGLAKATGEIFNWINSDDYLEPGALMAIGSYFATHPEKNVLCGFTHCFYDEDKSTSHTYQMGVKKTATETMINIAMNQPGTFFRTNVIRAIGGVNESLRYIFDNEMWFKYLAKFGVGSIGKTDTLIAHFRLHKDSKSVHEGFELFNRESLDIWKFLAVELNFDEDVIMLIANDAINNRYQSAAWDYAHIDKQMLEDHFAAKYMLSLMNKGRYAVARRGWMYKFKHTPFEHFRLTVSAFVKLFLLPGFLKK